MRSAHELFQLMYKLMKAKKEQLEAGPLSEEERHPDSKGTSRTARLCVCVCVTVHVHVHTNVSLLQRNLLQLLLLP